MNDAFKEYVDKQTHWLWQEDSHSPGQTLRLFFNPELIRLVDVTPGMGRHEAASACYRGIAKTLREVADYLESKAQ